RLLVLGGGGCRKRERQNHGHYQKVVHFHLLSISAKVKPDKKTGAREAGKIHSLAPVLVNPLFLAGVRR
ncbi:MAG: hypothetical protein AAB401_09160, partial [Acidobacteriota bacterium]